MKHLINTHRRNQVMVENVSFQSLPVMDGSGTSYWLDPHDSISVLRRDINTHLKELERRQLIKIQPLVEKINA